MGMGKIFYIVLYRALIKYKRKFLKSSKNIAALYDIHSPTNSNKRFGSFPGDRSV